MKNTLIISLVVFYANVNAQVTLEQTYDSAATFNVGGGQISQLLKVNFEQSGERFVKINRWNNTICIYNLNHSLLKIIDCTTLPLDPTTNKLGGILYLSENLFDTDPGIEFFYFVSLAGGSPYTGIYNDDASLIFSDTGAAWIYPGIPTQQLPIYNTAQGTKMILSYKNGQAKIFGLVGALVDGIQDGNNQLFAQNSLSNAYPNPTTNTTRIDYTLPKGTNEGEIVFYDLQGKEIKRFKIDRTFDSLLISTADIPLGTYLYQLQTPTQTSEGKKLIVIK